MGRNTRSYKYCGVLKADRLRERMKLAGLSQSELARRIGVTQPTIFRLFHGQVYGSTHLHRVARELGTTTAFLLGDVDDPDLDAPPAPELTHDEWAWVEYWRALDVDSRDAMVRVVRLLTTQHGADPLKATG